MIDYSKYKDTSLEDFTKVWKELMEYPESDPYLNQNIQWCISSYLAEKRFLEIGAEQFILNFYDEHKVPYKGYWTKRNKIAYDKFLGWCKAFPKTEKQASPEQLTYILAIKDSLEYDGIRIVADKSSFHSIIINI